MKLLAMDTSTVACSAALAVDGHCMRRHEVRPREHTRLLLPMIRSLLAEAGIGTAELDAIVVGSGPGSFIGMRIAASVAQGLCHASGVPLVAVSSLAVVAAEVIATTTHRKVLVAQDAHMGEVYLQGFRADGASDPAPAGPVRLQPAGRIDGADVDGYVAAGAGWERYPALLDANRERLAGRAATDLPDATWLLRLGESRFRAGDTLSPEALAPDYVRERVAVPAGRET